MSTAPKLWNVAVRVIANLPAEDGWSAVQKLSRALTQAGFDIITDDLNGLDVCSADVSVGAFEAEEGTEETTLPAHRAGRITGYDWGEVS
jgi:hypothetical protein